MFIAFARNSCSKESGPEDDALIGHGFHNGQGFNPDAFGPQGISAALKTLFNGNGRAADGAARLTDQLCQTDQGLRRPLYRQRERW